MMKQAHIPVQNLAAELAKAFGDSAVKAAPHAAISVNGEPVKVVLPQKQRKDAKDQKREKTQADLDAIKNAEMKRARKRAKHFNGETPFVLVDIGDDTMTRGDTHGYIGLAKRLAERLGAKLRIEDYNSLADRYPHLAATQAKAGSGLSAEANDLQRQRRETFYREEGYPDFLFSRTSSDTREYLEARAVGLRIRALNEALPIKLLGGAYKDKSVNGMVIPHHLTPDMLAHEGRRFAEEYAELPRPFIAINLVMGNASNPLRLPERLGALAAAYESATFFVCTCHRTDEQHRETFMKLLREQFAGGLKDKFPIVEFDFLANENAYGTGNYWNIYKGMLDQADHIVQYGSSGSMVAEALSTGKAVHLAGSDCNFPAQEKYIKRIFNYAAGEPLVTQRFAPLDLNADCVEALVKMREKHWKARHSRNLAEQIRNYPDDSIKPPHFKAYRQV